MIEDKKALRRKYIAVRDSVGEEKRESASRKIAEILFETDFYKQAKAVFAYVSFGSEVETQEILKKIKTDGKRLFVPLCDTENRVMSAVEIDDVSQLIRGAYGIMEPENKQRVAEKGEIDLIIAPALSFDKSGARLGYGGGYYDKFMEGFEGMTVGLCFDECLAEELPREEFDCKVDRVICPERMI